MSRILLKWCRCSTKRDDVGMKQGVKSLSSVLYWFYILDKMLITVFSF